MFKFIHFLFVLCCLSLALPVFAQKSPECQPILDAMLKVVSIDHSASSKDSSNRTAESITSDGKIYVQIDGQWQVSPVTLQEVLLQERENIQNAS